MKGEGRTIADGVVAALLARDDDVDDLAALLPPLRRGFDPSVSVDHREKAICGVAEREVRDQPWERRRKEGDGGDAQTLVLLHEVLVDGFVWRPERVDVGLVDRRAWETHGGPGAGGGNVELGLPAR